MRKPNDTFFKAYYPMEDGEEMEVQLAFHEGGINYVDYTTERKGLYLHFRPVRRERDGVFQCVHYMMMDDRAKQVCVAEMKRRNQKTGREKLAELKPNLKELADLAIAQDWQTLVDRVR